MPEEAQVWISSRKCKKGKSYHLRWLDPSTGRMKSRKAGTDRKRADREAALLERELEEGTFRLVRKAGWSQFVEDHVAKIPGRRNAVEAARTLKEFGKVCKVTGPRFVTFSTIERYVAHLRREDDQKRANSVATINKKLRYLRAAFNMAVKRGYAKANPMDGWRWDREDEKAIRIVSDVEEIAILNAAEAAYGFRWWAFIHVALNTGARRGELLSLSWDYVNIEDALVTFTATKGKKDRVVPLDSDTVQVLRRLQAQTLQEDGPFIGMGTMVERRWQRIVNDAGVKHCTLHDLRRTFVTRLIRAGVALPTVQMLVGHSTIQTTLRHYNLVSENDKREGIEKLRKAAIG